MRCLPLHECCVLLHYTRYNFGNLDELFPGENTTTEFMCKVIFDELCKEWSCKGFEGQLCVKLWESHKAWASYTGEVTGN